MSFANKTIVLTGASWNWAIAFSLAQQGASLVLGARNQVALEETVAACAKQEGKVIQRMCDSTRTMSAVDRAGDRLWAN